MIELKSSDGDSWYNSGPQEVRKRLSASLMFQTAYTFSRNIDTTQAPTFFSDATNGTTTAFAGTASSFGLIRSTVASARQIRLGLRVPF